MAEVSTGSIVVGVARVLAYLIIMFTSFIAAGIIGITAVKDFHNGCLLSSTIEAAPLSDCQLPCQQGQTCYGVPCGIDNKCQASYCVYIKDKPLVSPCKFCITFASVSGALGFLLAALNIYWLRKRSTSLLPGKKNVLLILFNVLMFIMTLAEGAVITAGFRSLCTSSQSFKEYIGDCTVFWKHIIDSNGSRIFPDFFNELFSAMVCAWIAMLCWLFLAVLSAVRLYLKVKGDDSSAESKPLLGNNDNQTSAPSSFPQPGQGPSINAE